MNKYLNNFMEKYLKVPRMTNEDILLDFKNKGLKKIYKVNMTREDMVESFDIFNFNEEGYLETKNTFSVVSDTYEFSDIEFYDVKSQIINFMSDEDKCELENKMTVQYEFFDETDKVKSVKIDDDFRVRSNEYNERGQLIRVHDIVCDTIYEYNKNNKLELVKTVIDMRSDRPIIFETKYNYNDKGQLFSKCRYKNSAKMRETNYSYDETGELNHEVSIGDYVKKYEYYTEEKYKEETVTMNHDGSFTVTEYEVFNNKPLYYSQKISTRDTKETLEFDFASNLLTGVNYELSSSNGNVYHEDLFYYVEYSDDGKPILMQYVSDVTYKNKTVYLFEYVKKPFDEFKKEKIEEFKTACDENGIGYDSVDINEADKGLDSHKYCYNNSYSDETLIQVITYGHDDMTYNVSIECNACNSIIKDVDMFNDDDEIEESEDSGGDE